MRSENLNDETNETFDIPNPDGLVHKMPNGSYIIVTPQETTEEQQVVTTFAMGDTTSEAQQIQYQPGNDLIPTTDENAAIRQDVSSLRPEVDDLKRMLIAQSEMLGKIFSNTANVDRLIGDFLKNSVTSNVVESTVETLESFHDLGSMEKITTTADMEAFQLNDKSFSDRFIRFYNR